MHKNEITDKEIVIDQLRLLVEERGLSYESSRKLKEERYVIWNKDSKEYLRVPIEYFFEIPYFKKLIKKLDGEFLWIDNEGNFINEEGEKI